MASKTFRSRTVDEYSFQRSSFELRRLLFLRSLALQLGFAASA
jgi:hypothetical protein